jgi:hypothetical protein
MNTSLNIPSVGLAAALFDGPQYRNGFKRALENALGGLKPRDRNLLRLHYAAGVSVDGLGRAYRVQHATAARWLTRIRGQLLDNIRKELHSLLATLNSGDPRASRELVSNRLDHDVSNWLSSERFATDDQPTATPHPAT